MLPLPLLSIALRRNNDLLSCNNSPCSIKIKTGCTQYAVLITNISKTPSPTNCDFALSPSFSIITHSHQNKEVGPQSVSALVKAQLNKYLPTGYLFDIYGLLTNKSLLTDIVRSSGG